MNRIKKALDAMGRKQRVALKLGLGVLLGAAGGYAYYAFVGCATGTCPITSNPLVSTGYGALIGAVLVGWK